MNPKILVNTIQIPKISDDAVLCFMEGRNHIPFDIKRTYFILLPEPNLSRGYHAHHQTNQALFCIQGSARLIVDNGWRREEIVLKNRPETGVILPAMLWHEMRDMNTTTILLVMADREYDPGDYIRDYKEFLSLVRKTTSK